MKSIKGLTWKLRGGEISTSGSLLDRVLTRRGVMPSEAPLFLAPRLADLSNPFAFSQMKKAVGLLRDMKRGSRVLIYGDYDVDGIASSVILNEMLSRLGLRAEVYIPERRKEGYGMKLERIKQLVKSQIDCLIAVDSGISALEEISFLKKKGIPVLVLDHHEPQGTLPSADVILNPKVPGESYPFEGLSSSGITFQLARALEKRISGSDTEALRYLDLAALGTISDIVPLISDNRIIAKFGLERISRSPRPGLAALRRLLALEGDLDTHHISFMIGPRLNAAGRIKHADLAYHLLTAEDILEAYEMAQNLQELNLARQNLTDRILLEALAAADKQKDKKILIVSGKGWSIGVAGIVANRLVESFHKPALVFEEEGSYLRGSARSIEGIDIYQLINPLKEFLESFGGHAGAAGLTLQAKNFSPFQKKLWQLTAKKIPAELLAPTLILDEELRVGEVTPQLHAELTRLKPYGTGNEEPIFWLKDASIQELRVIEGTRRGPHLKLIFEGLKIPAYWFGEGEKAPLFSGDRKVEGALSFGTMNYLGQPILRLKLHDIKLTS